MSNIALLILSIKWVSDWQKVSNIVKTYVFFFSKKQSGQTKEDESDDVDNKNPKIVLLADTVVVVSILCIFTLCIFIIEKTTICLYAHKRFHYIFPQHFNLTLDYQPQNRGPQLLISHRFLRYVQDQHDQQSHPCLKFILSTFWLAYPFQLFLLNPRLSFLLQCDAQFIIDKSSVLTRNLIQYGFDPQNIQPSFQVLRCVIASVQMLLVQIWSLFFSYCCLGLSRGHSIYHGLIANYAIFRCYCYNCIREEKCWLSESVWHQFFAYFGIPLNIKYILWKFSTRLFVIECSTHLASTPLGNIRCPFVLSCSPLDFDFGNCAIQLYIIININIFSRKSYEKSYIGNEEEETNTILKQDRDKVVSSNNNKSQ